MGLLLFRVCLVINAFNIATENPVTTKPYRFPVYPVNECPRSKDEFKTAAQRRNCTKGLRYLCAPNKYLSSLIEFCTDRQIGLYQEGNCVILEGTGDLDHYSCVEKFNSSCPLEFYNDEEIYKYPACLQIDRELRCFAADNGCKKRKFHTTESNLNISKMETVGNETFRGASRGWLAIGYIIATAAVLAVIILSWIIFQKRKREQVEKCKDNSENETLLKDNPEIDDDKLRQFLSKGEITVCHVRCIIVGCAKAGKTTLLKRLQNVSFDELMQIERTEMVDFHVNSFDVLLEEETIKSVEKEDTLPTILFSKEKLEMPLKENDGKMAKETHQPGVEKEDTLPTILFSKEKLKENDGKMAKETHQPENIPMVILKNQANNDNAENEEKLIFEPHSQDTTLVQNQFSPEPNEKHGEDIDANVDKIDFEKFAILKIKDAVNELLNEKELRPRITFLDFAGQSMYYAFHQIFLRPKSCSILVVDMTKSLYDKVGDQDENEKECSRFASWRYKDYYKFWLKSIDSFSDTESPVIIVVTHADKLSKEECRQFLKSLKDLFDNWSHSGLRRHLNEDRMYTIGFPDSGSELEDLKDLKKCIANIVKCPRYSKENIRPVWALFEHILNKMKETEKVIPRKTLSDYSDQLSAQEFRMDESEISKMLVFFHRVGVLLYFDKDGLKEKIILDIQWLLDAFKCIIEYPVRTEENDMKRKHFRRTGELDDVELDRIWHVEGKDFLKHKTTIIAYMQQLGLLMPLKELHSIDSPVYYFPSMNSKRFDKTGEHNSKSSILCFKFDDEMQLPINVFHGIVLKCSKLNNWSILTEEEKYNICLYQNAACFSFQKHVVVLRNCNFEIRVQVWASPTIYDGRLLKKIKHSVEDIIRDDKFSYKIGYKCRKDVLNDEEDKSFISQSTFPVSNYLCETCDVDKKHVVDNDICWELEVNENKVDELTTFASSPEFASMPAKISPEARKAQEPIVSAGKAMIDGACHMVTAAKQLAVNPKDPPTYQLYSNHSKSVSEASIKDCAPGQRECDESIDKLNRSIRDLDQASLAAISQSLQQRTEKSLRGFQEQMIGSAREIHDLCSKVKDSAKAEPENLGHRVTMMASYFGPLSDGAVGAASLIQNSKQQTHILDLTKTVAESALQFMYSCKEGGGNPKAPKHTHDNIDTAADNTMDVVQDLLQSLEEAASQAGVVNSMIEKLTKSITKTDEQVMVREGMSFVEYQSNMVSLAKKIAMTTQEMVGKAGVNPGDLGRLANQLTRDYDMLASNSANAAATSNSQDIANRIRTTVQDLGKSCVELVQDAGKVQGDPHDTYARRDLQDHARSVSEKVAFVLAALQSGSRGTQACINAASAVSRIIADLDTTIMFATAGTLCTEGDDSFTSHREDILKTAKALVNETKKLVQGAASDQETLAEAAQQAVKTITKLADVVKLGAASLGSNQPEAQVMIINAVKDVASALSDLISATKNASGKNVSDPAMMTLKESAKVMVTNVTSLLKTVKTVEDEAARGTRALESTIEAIGQEVKSYEAGTLPEKKATAEDLIRLTKPITTATAKAVAAGNSGRQEDVIICANMGRKAIFDLLATCRGTASTAETTEVRQKTIAAGKNCAVVYKDLLEQVSTVVQKPSQEAKQTLAARAHQVAVSVQEIVHCSELIKGTDWVDPEDPTVIAESELLTAAKSIEAAAQKLSQLKPRKKAKEADMSLNFEEQILEAAKSIASATAALVKSASAAQRELVAQGKVRTRKEIGATYHKSQILDDDGQWSEGLISAAKMVAAATHSLCESANAMVQGHATEERLIASAKEVAGSTAHLLVACRVKADPDSVAMKRLQAAGNAVKRATEVLVKAAQQAKQRDEDEDINVAVDSRKVGGIKQELQIQEEMLRKEREWIEAREKLAKFRKQRYKDTGHDSDSSSAF